MGQVEEPAEDGFLDLGVAADTVRLTGWLASAGAEPFRRPDAFPSASAFLWSAGSAMNLMPCRLDAGHLTTSVSVTSWPTARSASQIDTQL